MGGPEGMPGVWEMEVEENSNGWRLMLPVTWTMAMERMWLWKMAPGQRDGENALDGAPRVCRWDVLPMTDDAGVAREDGMEMRSGRGAVGLQMGM